MEKRERSSAAPVVVIVVVVCVVLLPFAYILSIGPAAWLITHGFLPISGESTCFAPCGFLSQRSEWFNGIMTWYLSWFI